MGSELGWSWVEFGLNRVTVWISRTGNDLEEF